MVGNNFEGSTYEMVQLKCSNSVRELYNTIIE